MPERLLPDRTIQHDLSLRGVPQPGRGPALGAGCCRFKSCHPDSVLQISSVEPEDSAAARIVVSTLLPSRRREISFCLGKRCSCSSYFWLQALHGGRKRTQLWVKRSRTWSMPTESTSAASSEDGAASFSKRKSATTIDRPVGSSLRLLAGGIERIYVDVGAERRDRNLLAPTRFSASPIASSSAPHLHPRFTMRDDHNSSD